MTQQKVAMLTAGGLAPCLSAVVSMLIKRYDKVAPDIELIAYRSGYQGLLLGDRIEITQNMREKADLLKFYGGSPIGNSRVKLTNVADCMKRQLIKENENPLEVAANRLIEDKVSILHTIGGDDTNTTASDLVDYLSKRSYKLTVVGVPKTIDNDISPIHQSLGALTAAKLGAKFFDNISNECTAAPFSLIIHEVMGRNCGWLTAATARSYIEMIQGNEYADGFMISSNSKSIDGIYLPEMQFDLVQEAERLKAVINNKGSVSIFVSEGACLDAIIAEREASGVKLQRDAFGHVRLNAINVGDWFSEKFAELIGAKRSIVQKSGYFVRSAASEEEDLQLIEKMVILAVDSALSRISGVIGEDETQGNVLKVIDFKNIRGGKAFNVSIPWFSDVLKHTGQNI
ncbi:Pyrophosphate--fructose 6-phosphate 1-phosphotransferase, alpha subunit [Liberibacter crescens BT-1]|uniref:Pyrophosphate--fructose 6-phosphate 1-phosphotransferase n=1 Tax=Liberibacter crescens (strain BT-1) TaxID=1215343 RepID=L0EVM9_LIBCB|nr:pyrophosphate--fructose-6-phosphate 1-phosphotransferase [Liberibacter crescens]AGA64915.1 Pyrophosphate--fructose 6-phosphate 1-phosphotransferase, alpha subunit [Liberibacter crescens BT-1]AMC12941.1 pyrophosphate--fructose-6-phosphate 1-phosphotransferase [Liberibacter crescens]